ncbi:hypothetical protein [Vibrio neptunius]|uniref:hypothetical protein n=1 Tax=Vibrio neptunius TaxID=170651 RepID=UPI0019D21899|nr:hypothetical protein [Vibrio neptunius]MBN3571892.1 hypothetical protein [Vibrio neptunius]QXX05655.1 hypothetical protein KW548_10580 [Vibrio neptunius]
MKQRHTLEPNQTLSFNAGQAGKFLILRESTHDLLLWGDALRPTEIQRGDTIDVTAFNELTLENHHRDAATFEYQISDVPILTQAQKIDVSNSVLVHEVQRPVNVVEIQRPVKTDIQNPLLNVQVDNDRLDVNVVDIQRPVKTDIQNPLLNVHVDNDSLNVTSNDNLYTYAPIKDGVLELKGRKQIIEGSEARKALILQLPDINVHSVLVQGFIILYPGGHLTLNTNQDVTVQSQAWEYLKIGEMR